MDPENRVRVRIRVVNKDRLWVKVCVMAKFRVRNRAKGMARSGAAGGRS